MYLFAGTIFQGCHHLLHPEETERQRIKLLPIPYWHSKTSHKDLFDQDEFSYLTIHRMTKSDIEML